MLQYKILQTYPGKRKSDKLLIVGEFLQFPSSAQNSDNSEMKSGLQQYETKRFLEKCFILMKIEDLQKKRKC